MAVAVADDFVKRRVAPVSTARDRFPSFQWGVSPRCVARVFQGFKTGFHLVAARIIHSTASPRNDQSAVGYHTGYHIRVHSSRDFAISSSLARRLYQLY